MIKCFLTSRSFKKENSFDAAKGKDKNSCQVTYEEILELIKKFANLYDKDGMEILRILRELPEFRGSTELQYKTIMSVIVLSYRSVQENVERRRRMIFEILGDQPSENEESENLDNAFYRYMSRKAMDEHGINGTTKEVTLQIWNSLYNLPSLRTCTLFNKFILDCVRTIWDLVTGMNGKPPRMYIEYESRQFDASKHQRHSVFSNTQSITIQQYLWPAIIDKRTGTCVHKAIVIT
uniref:Mitochondria-eating protein n=1 Tax=Onchocerca volvulus TaxID=6282 RepID=A0A2K6VIQ4_ONCVO